MEEKKYVAGCKTCENYQGKIVEKASPTSEGVVYAGYVAVGNTLYGYVVVESDKKAAEKHFIVTTVSHHVGAEMVEVRAALNAGATRLASFLFGTNYRLIINSGSASSIDHYHCHIIVPGANERLPRAVANVQKVIEELSAPPEVKAALDKALLQQKAR